MSAVSSHSEAIAGVFHDWLKNEVKTSANDRNQHLDDFVVVRQRMSLGYENPENWSAQKNEGHLNRLPVWFDGYELNPVGDEQAEYLQARLLFSPLMLISGAFRNHALLQSRDQNEYLYRRSQGIGIDLEEAVSKRLHTHLPSTGNFANTRLSLEEVRARMELSIDIGRTTMEVMCAVIQGGEDSYSRASGEMERAQYNWATFATDVLTLAAKLRKGELAAVPFLEPRSITDQSGKILYPLAA